MQEFKARMGGKRAKTTQQCKFRLRRHPWARIGHQVASLCPLCNTEAPAHASSSETSSTVMTLPPPNILAPRCPN